MLSRCGASSSKPAAPFVGRVRRPRRKNRGIIGTNASQRPTLGDEDWRDTKKIIKSQFIYCYYLSRRSIVLRWLITTVQGWWLGPLLFRSLTCKLKGVFKREDVLTKHTSWNQTKSKAKRKKNCSLRSLCAKGYETTTKIQHLVWLNLRLIRRFVSSVLVGCSNMQLSLEDQMRHHVHSVTRCSLEVKLWWSIWSTPIRIRMLRG